MADDNQNQAPKTGRLLLEEKDFVEVEDAAGNPLPDVPKHWGKEDLEPGAKKKGSSRSRSSKPDEPAGNASRDAWVEYAKATKDAKDSDLVDGDGNDLTRDQLREKFATPTA